MYARVLCLSLFCYAFTLCRTSFAIILKRERERELVALLLLVRMFCYCKCSVTLPHGAVGWSAVCDCGIS